ncbi:aldehyde dehydrogenase family-domain-containing protein [Terfezia claveryi]|nr:aldehyde dehydrogenase family-domain-containing protein [Terfezia claveryi]
MAGGIHVAILEALAEHSSTIAVSVAAIVVATVVISNRKIFWFVRPASCADIDAAIVKAAKAQASWARTSFNERRKVLRTLQGYILANQDAIVQASCLDSGKTRVDAALGEILVTTEKIKYLLDYGEKALRPEKRPTSFMMSASQNCIGIERIIALPKVYKQLTDILELRISKLRLGSAVDEDQVHMGAMIAPTCFDKLERIIKEAVGKGARCLGHYFQPTLLVDVTPDMEIAQNETFAPICVLMPVQNVDEAIKIANSANFGLGGSVYGKNQAHIDRELGR